jgi:hypothetical protein
MTDSAAYLAAIREAVRYERMLAVKAIVPFAVVALVITAYLFFR